jgi:hypothetical protein
MNEEATKTLGRIEATLDRVANLLPIPEEQAQKLDEMGETLEKLLAQAERQTALLEKLWSAERTRQ